MDKNIVGKSAAELMALLADYRKRLLNRATALTHQPITGEHYHGIGGGDTRKAVISHDSIAALWMDGESDFQVRASLDSMQ